MISLSQLAKLLGADLRGVSTAIPAGSAETAAPGDPGVAGVASISRATPQSVVFAADASSFAAAVACAAAAVLVSAEVAGDEAGVQKPALLCAHPKLTFARAAKLLRSPGSGRPASAIHPSAVIAQGAVVEDSVSVGACAVVDEGARIGAGTEISSGAMIGSGVIIGRDCRIYPRAVLYPGTSLGDRVVVHAGVVLGSDGFGYVRDPETGEYLQFPQQGSLVIEDDVEIGANTAIDRGALEETRIGRGTKIDNLVHVGHNCQIGRNAVLAAQIGISGSSIIGHGAVLGGQVGIGDHAEVGDGVILGGQAGILPHKKLHGPGILFWGTPAQPVKRYLRQLAALARLSKK